MIIHDRRATEMRASAAASACLERASWQATAAYHLLSRDQSLPTRSR
jgi:hypothetical protein